MPGPRPDTVLIFAAGLGTRMRPLTDTLPKPLIPVAGRPLIDHALGLAQAAGVARKVVNTHYFADRLQGHLADRPDVVISHEARRPLETGGGLRHALPLMARDAVFTLNPDVVWTGANPLARLGDAWDGARMDALLMLVPLSRATGYAGAGDFSRDADGRLRRSTATDPDPFVFTGAEVIATAPVAAHAREVFSLNEAWERMIARGRLYGIVHEGGWADAGTPRNLRLAAELIAGERDV